MKILTIDGILYSFDLEGYGYPCRCDKDHIILENVDQKTGEHKFRCNECEKDFEIKKEEEG